MIPHGYSFYGQDIGILVNSSASPRIPGDAGHSQTFKYPVRYQVTGTSFRDLVNGSEQALKKLVEAGLSLKQDGIKGVVADCGLMSLYQEEFVAETGLPFVGSSLCQLPMIWQLIGCQGRIGILTGHSDFLKRKHLEKSGWTESISIAIEGMESRPHFNRIVIEGYLDLDPELMQQEVIEAAVSLMQKNSDMRAILLECSNLASYSRAVSGVLGLPVFDTISAANLLQYSLCPPQY